VPDGVSSFDLQHPLVSLRSTSSCLLLLPRLRITHILPSIFPATTCLRRVFLRKMWPMQLAFTLFIVRAVQHGTYQNKWGANQFIPQSYILRPCSSLFRYWTTSHWYLSHVTSYALLMYWFPNASNNIRNTCNTLCSAVKVHSIAPCCITTDRVWCTCPYLLYFSLSSSLTDRVKSNNYQNSRIITLCSCADTSSSV
jgi:hypothetical protein